MWDLSQHQKECKIKLKPFNPILDVHKPVINFPQPKIKEEPLSGMGGNMISHQVKILESILPRIIMILNLYSKSIKKRQKEKPSDYHAMYK